jgi:hypothetical protein
MPVILPAAHEKSSPLAGTLGGFVGVSISQWRATEAYAAARKKRRVYEVFINRSGGGTSIRTTERSILEFR